MKTSNHFSTHLPRRGLVLFMFAGGLVTLVVWGMLRELSHSS